MKRQWPSWLLAGCLWSVAACPAGRAQDTDRDGIPAAVEEQLMLDDIAEDDNRQRVHFLCQPIAFRGGERLTLRTGRTGNHITEDVLLLAQRPPERGRKFELGQIEAGWLRRGDEGLLRLTWITTWPAACTVEYGLNDSYGQKITEPAPLANHRIDLSGLRPGQLVHYRVAAPRPGGQPVTGPDMTFRCQPPEVAVGTAKQSRVELDVENPFGFALTAFPITAGVPFSKGELTSAENVRLLDAARREAALQTAAGTRWPDGSIKWLFVSFLAAAEPQKTAKYALEYGTEVRRSAAASSLVCRRQADAVSIDTGALEVSFDGAKSGFPTSMRASCMKGGEDPLVGPLLAAEVTDCQGRRFTSLNPPERIEVEEAGPIRAVVHVAGHHLSPAGQKMFAYTANNDMTSEILFFAHRLTGDPQFAEIGMRAMRAQFADGLGSIAHLRGTPHLIYNMDLVQSKTR